MDEVANALGLDPLEVRRRNLIRHEEFPYLIPSGTTYDSGDYHTVVDKVLAHTIYDEMKAERDRLRAEGKLAGIGIAACLEPSGGNASFEPLLNPKNATTTWMDSVPHRCRSHRPRSPSTMHTTSSGQGHETLVATVIGEVLQIDPDTIRVVRANSLNSCRATRRSAAAWRSCSAARRSTRRRSSRPSSSLSARIDSASRRARDL